MHAGGRLIFHSNVISNAYNVPCLSSLRGNNSKVKTFLLCNCKMSRPLTSRYIGNQFEIFPSKNSLQDLQDTVHWTLASNMENKSNPKKFFLISV